MPPGRGVGRYRRRMPTHPDAAALAAALPGDWIVAASNLPLWVVASPTALRFHYELRS